MVFRVQNYKKMLIEIRFGNEYSYHIRNFKLNRYISSYYTKLI